MLLIGYALLQAIGFKIVELGQRRIREHGVSAHGVLGTYRWALLPALIWSACFLPAEEIRSVLHHPQIIGYLAFIAVAWNVQVFINVHLAGITPSAGMLLALQKVLYIPTLIVVGTWLNNQPPSWWSLVSVAALSIALMLQPTAPEAPVRRTTWSLLAIVALAFVRIAADSLGNGVYKEALRVLPPEVMLALFATLTLFTTSLVFLFRPVSDSDQLIIRQYPWLAIWVPVLWFASSIPETFAVAGMTIYTLFSLGCITFLMDISSDLKHRRIVWSARTAAFVLLTIGGILAAAVTV